MRTYVISAAGFFMAAAAAAAPMPVPAAPAACKETVSFEIVYNFRAKSFADAKNQFDNARKDVIDYAKQQHIPKMDYNYVNYNLNLQQLDYDDGVLNYQLKDGYQLDSLDAAFKIGDYLKQKKSNAQLNITTKGGSCGNAVAP